MMCSYMSITFPSITGISPSPRSVFIARLHGMQLLISRKGKYPFPIKDNVVPGSDGAGTVEAVGDRVTRFKPGDKVLTLFNQAHYAGPISVEIIGTGLGGVIDGTLRQYGSFEENGLVHMPSTLDFKQGSTLPCAALTAWNALYGLESKALKPGQTVLTQGTGGVSIFALQVKTTPPQNHPPPLNSERKGS